MPAGWPRGEVPESRHACRRFRHSLFDETQCYAVVRFPRRDPADFGPEVKRRVAAYFAERSLSDKANASMVAKTAVLIAVTIGSYLLLLSNRIPPWGMLGLAVVMGVGIAGLGFCVAHDALNGAYSRRPAMNRVLGFS